MATATVLVILAAAVAHFILGAIWYSKSLFGKPWLALLGKSEDQCKEEMKNIKPMVVTFFCYVASATVLFGLIKAVRHGICEPGVKCLGMNGSCVVAPGSFLCGMVIAIAVYMGISGAVTLSNYMFEGKSLKLYFLNFFYNLIGFALMGAILGTYIR